MSRGAELLIEVSEFLSDEYDGCHGKDNDDYRSDIFKAMNAVQHASKHFSREKLAIALLREWRETGFFSDKQEWQKWADEFGARVDRLLRNS